MERLIIALQQIDWVKNAIQFMIYLLIIVLTFFVVLKPQLDSYRGANIEYRKAQMLHKQSQDEFNTKSDEIKRLQNENQSILSAFVNSYNKEKIEKSLGAYFESFEIVSERLATQEEGFLVKRLEVNSKLRDSESYYEFILGLNSSGYILKSDFPINFNADENGITTNFFLNLYSVE